jgi:hypothetical protein
MKKFIVLSLAGILIFALGATVYAQAPKLEFRVSGFIDAQTFLLNNVPPRNTSAGLLRVTPPTAAFWPYGSGQNPPFGPVGGSLNGVRTAGLNQTQSYWDSRMSLKMDMVMGPNLSGTVMFEIDSNLWGSGPYGLGSATGLNREAGGVGYWSTDRTAVEIKNVYIDFGLPYLGIPVPITVRVGAQPISIRPHMLVYTDGMGVTAAAKIDPVQVSFIYAKAVEGLTYASDDSDVYALQANVKLGTITAGGYGMWYNMNTYPFWVVSTIAGLPAGLNPAINGTMRSTMYWFGAYVDGKAGPVNLNFDFVYDYGKVAQKNIMTGSIQTRDVNYSGWATRMKIDFPWEKFNFGVVGMYASGSDANETSVSGLPGTTVANGAAGMGPYGATLSKKVTGYVVPPGSEQDTNNQESMVVYGMEAGASGGAGIAETANYNQVNRGAFGGTWFAKLYGSAKLTPWYKVTLQGLYIGDTTAHGNSLGSAVKYPGTTSPQLRDNSEIGWELDLINEIWIYNNLRFMVGGGILWNGGALDLSRVTSAPGAPPIYYNARPSTPWAVRTRLVYTF